MRATLKQCWPGAVLAGVVAAGFLAVGAATFPMDDAWIHAVYARNLAEHHRLTFNLTPPDPGLGTTSILWPLLLAGLHPLVGVVAAARLLGVGSYLAIAVLATLVAGWMTAADDRRGARLAGVLVILSGNLVWFSLSGMETSLWVALGLGALVAYQRRRWVGLGLLLGLLMLTRIEGVVLLFAIGLVELRAERRLPRGLVLSGLLAGLLLAPWLDYVHARTGHYLPTSYSGKKHAQVRGAVQTVNEVLGQARGSIELEEAKLPAWTALIYPLGVASYGLAFVAGGAYLPGPRVPIPGELGAVLGGLSLTALLALGLFGWVWWPALRRAARLARRPDWAAPTHRALLALALWFLLHNLAYWLKLPTPGTASRYQVVNHLAWWLLLGVGLSHLRLPARRWAAPAVALLAVINTGFWWTVYASDVRHMRDVRLASARYISANLPPDAIVAAHDIGALGWAMNRPCVDLGGLIDPAWLAAAKAGRQAEFLREVGADYLVLPTKHSTEARPFFDYQAFLGLRDNPGIRLQPVQAFENDYRDWARGAAPTWNALAGVTVYRFDWAGGGAGPPAGPVNDPNEARSGDDEP